MSISTTKGSRIRKGLILAGLAAASGCFIPLSGRLPFDSPHSRQTDPEYRFQLAPDRPRSGHGYSRRELENFLFCMSEGTMDVPIDFSRFAADPPRPGAPFIQAIVTPENRAAIGEQEVRRWFENPVTVRLRGAVTPSLRRMTVDFFSLVNALSGTVKFAVLDGDEPAHLVIEFFFNRGAARPGRFHQVGETSDLSDRLRIHLGLSGGRLTIEPFLSSAQSQPRNARFVQFSPRDLEFQKTRRMVKACVQIHASAVMQRRLLVHELLHALGFPGHSPFPECELFPLASAGETGTADHFLSPLTRSMLEMLYRPEILPGMSLGEAGDILGRLPRTGRTTPRAVREFLQARERELLARKQRWLQAWQPRFADRLSKLVRLDELQRRWQDFMEEWRELYRDEKRNTRIIDWMAGSRPFVIRRAIINFRLHRLSAMAATASSRHRRNLIAEERMILQDLLKAGEKRNAYESGIHSDVLGHPTGEFPEEIRMRRLVRQLRTLRSQLGRGTQPLPERP